MLDWRGYMDLLRTFTSLTGRKDLYSEKVDSVQRPIEEMIAAAQASEGYGERTVLLLRAYASSVRAKDSESTVAGYILDDMGLVNIADSDSSMLENLTMEAILAADPDYIFVVTMGADVEAAERALEQTLLEQPHGRRSPRCARGATSYSTGICSTTGPTAGGRPYAFMLWLLYAR